MAESFPRKDNPPQPKKPFDAEGLGREDNIAIRENRREGRPDDPTLDGMPVKNSQPFKRLTNGRA